VIGDLTCAHFEWCRVCGHAATFGYDDPALNRCERHFSRNPCAVEGCARSTKGQRGWYGNDLWLCSEHWRLIAPRSAERRIYHRIFRTAKRYGWNDDLRARFWRIWRQLVVRARRRAAGDIDMSEINRIMGW
jgi:hypothetical protein